MNARVPKTSPTTPPVWRQSDGKAVSCLEKIKVLNQNIQEIEALCADALEDGVLMGCDADQIKAALHELIGRLEGEGWEQNERSRFRHSETYLREQGAQAGLETVEVVPLSGQWTTGSRSISPISPIIPRCTKAT